jgi:hypothetical protein
VRFAIALAFTVLYLVGSSLPVSAAAGASLCGLGFVRLATARCFAPREVAAAEKRMPVTPVRPPDAMWRKARLRLTQVAVRSYPSEIDYLHGRIPENLRGLPAFVLSPPFYVLVKEIVGSNPALRKKVVHMGYWEFDARFHCRNLTLEIASNTSGALVRWVGNAILRVERCGK